MLLVRNVMTQDVKTVSPEMDAFDAAGVMRSHDVGSAPVVDGDGHLVGIVTDRDLVIRVLGDRTDPTKVRVGDVATRRSIFTISPDAQVSEARALMATERIRRLPVVKGEQLVGIVSRSDILRVRSEQLEHERPQPGWQGLSFDARRRRARGNAPSTPPA